jgi:hypothetical protein
MQKTTKRPQPLKFLAPPEAMVPELGIDEVMAIKCLAQGTANEGQQKMFFQTLIEKFCIYGNANYFGTDRADAYANGRRYVAIRLLQELNKTLAKN